MPTRPYLLPIIAATIGFYPIYAVLLFAADTIIGSRQLLNWIGFESHHTLFFQSITDAAAAIGPGSGIALLLALGALIVWPVRGIIRKAALLLVVLLAPTAVLSLLGFTLSQALLVAAAWLLSTIVALVLSRILVHAR